MCYVEVLNNGEVAIDARNTAGTIHGTLTYVVQHSIDPLFQVRTLSTSASINANNGVNLSIDVPVIDGFTFVGVVGFNSSSWECCFASARPNGNTISASLFNSASSKMTPTIRLNALYIATPQHSIVPTSYSLNNGATLDVVGKIGIIVLSRTITGTIQPWQEILSYTLPDGISAKRATVNSLTLDGSGNAPIAIAINGKTITVANRSSSSYKTGDVGQLLRGELVFALSQYSIDQVAYSHTVGSASPSAAGVAFGYIDVPDGCKCIGIVGLSSNHNYGVAFGRHDITADGEYTIVAKPDSTYSDLIVNFRVLMIRAQPLQQLPLLTHCALRHSCAQQR